ncbi:MAG: hypothetical protein ACO1PZ_15230, partial [Gammaproteobacteria bacterium]
VAWLLCALHCLAAEFLGVSGSSSAGHTHLSIGRLTIKGVYNSWVTRLTNAIEWRLYRIKFGQPVDYEEVSSFVLPEVNLKREEDQRRLFLICREGLTSDAMGIYHQHISVLNKFTVAQVLLSEPVASVIRREMRRYFPDLKIDVESITDLLNNDILKREVIDGDKVKDAQQRLKRAASKLAKAQQKSEPQAPEVAMQASAEVVES